MTYVSTKTYGHEVGLSCAFRQWRADSHCRKIHGYAIAVRLEFEAHKLDHRNWVVDFGNLKWVKKFLEDTFDHKLLVAEDDPNLSVISGTMFANDLADVIVMPKVGCEAFAEYIYNHVAPRIQELEKGRVVLRSVEVREHGANSAIYEAPKKLIFRHAGAVSE